MLNFSVVYLWLATQIRGSNVCRKVYLFCFEFSCDVPREMRGGTGINFQHPRGIAIQLKAPMGPLTVLPWSRPVWITRPCKLVVADAVNSDPNKSLSSLGLLQVPPLNKIDGITLISPQRRTVMPRFPGLNFKTQRK